MAGEQVRRRAATVAVVVMVLVLGGAGPAAAAAPEPTRGIVGTLCDPGRIAANRAVGIEVAVLGARWDLLFPTRGTPDPQYRVDLANVLRRCAAGGMRVILDAGVHHAPAWARQLRGALLRDQYGDRPVNSQLDLIFRAEVRTAVAEYLRALVAELPPYTIEAIRVGTTSSGELGLPGGMDGGRGNSDSWWAFGAAAQNGSGIAAGQSRSPLPGWIPGRPTWNNRTVTAADALTWFRWYERSVAQTEVWLARTVLGAGFRGAIHLPVAGRGVLPADLAAATSTLLAGAARRDDAFARGLDYTDQMPLLAAALPGVVIDLTSVDDATAVTARALNPPQDMCTLADSSAVVAPGTPVERWSNLRFARAHVARAGLAAVGENPGPPAPETGGVPGSDSEAEQLRRSPGYARGCGLAALLFAFEDDLHTGRSGITTADYAAAWQ